MASRLTMKYAGMARTFVDNQDLDSMHEFHDVASDQNNQRQLSSRFCCYFVRQLGRDGVTQHVVFRTVKYSARSLVAGMV